MPPADKLVKPSAVKKRSAQGKTSDSPRDSDITVFGDENFQGNSETFEVKQSILLFGQRQVNHNLM